MTHGTLPDTLVEVDGDDAGPRRRGRTGIKIAAAAMIVALTAGGAYAVIGGGSPDRSGTATSAVQPATDTGTADTGTGDTGTGDTGTGDTGTGDRGTGDTGTGDTDEGTPAKVKPAPKAEKPKPKLPSAKNMTIGEKRTALIAYLKQGGFPLTKESSPATAAKGACTLLEGGMKSEKLITELSRGANVSVAQGRHFLIGATHFYCPQFSVKA